MKREIAIVEDEPAILENYCDALRNQGYRVSGYRQRKEALQAFQRHLPDLVILDIGLGSDRDAGFDLCRQLRARSEQLPIIFLTARDSDLDVISGLRIGADDYLTKQISMPHLSARISALFRRLEVQGDAAAAQNIVDQGPLRMDMDRIQVSWREHPLDLTVTELWIIHALASYPGHVRTRDQLMDAANILIDSTSISTYIKRIRRKFEQIDPDFDAIDTVYGMGYRWRGTD